MANSLKERTDFLENGFQAGGQDSGGGAALNTDGGLTCPAATDQRHRPLSNDAGQRRFSTHVRWRVARAARYSRIRSVGGGFAVGQHEPPAFGQGCAATVMEAANVYGAAQLGASDRRRLRI